MNDMRPTSIPPLPYLPGWQLSPVPGWGNNPANAGPRRIAVGSETPLPIDLPPQAAAGLGIPPQAAAGLGCPGVGCAGRVGQAEGDKYRQTSWGIVAAVAAGGLLVGLMIGYAAGKRAKMRPNRRGRAYSPNARWSTRYKNRLPDSHFLYVAPGGRKERIDGRVYTVPRSKRKLPVISRSGDTDVRHVNNALSRLGQPKTQVPSSARPKLVKKALRLKAMKTGAPLAELEAARAKRRRRRPRRLAA